MIPDLRPVLDILRSRGVCRYIVPDVDFNLKSWQNADPAVYRCWGCHPSYTASEWQEPCAPVAVGECGLEPARNSDDTVLQELLFERQVEFAMEKELPLVIHSIRRDDRILHMLKALCFSGTGVIHGFSGNRQMAKRWIDAGFCLGIGTLILSEKASGLRDAVAYSGADYIVLETDAPAFRRTNPLMLLDVAECCTACLDISKAELSRITENTVSRIFKVADVSSAECKELE